MVGGVAVAAAARTFPFRVFSFPSEIIPPTAPLIRELGIIYYDKTALDALKETMMFGTSVWRFKYVSKESLKSLHLSGYPLNV